MPPSISIIIPTFNRPEKLTRALRSALGQSVPPDEILVVDNGENPETRPAVEAVGREFPGTSPHYLTSPPFDGRKAIATGIEAAAGDGWILLLDDDDFLLPGRLEHDRARIPELPEDTILLIHDFIRVDYERGRIWEHHMAHKKLGLYEALVLENFPPPPAATFRADVLKAHHSFHRPKGWTDFDLYASVLPFGHTRKSGDFGYIMDDTRVPGRMTSSISQTLEMVEIHRERFREQRRQTDVPEPKIDHALDRQRAFYSGKALGYKAFLNPDCDFCRKHPLECVKGVAAPLRSIVTHLVPSFVPLPEMRGSHTCYLRQFARKQPEIASYIKDRKMSAS